MSRSCLQILVFAATFTGCLTANAQFRQQNSSTWDPWVRQAQALPPYDPNVSLQGIQPFDPYGSTAGPSLPPPLPYGGGSAYPAPPSSFPGGFNPPSSVQPGYPGNFGPGGGAGGVGSGGPFQPAFNFQGGGLYGGFQAAILEPRYGNFTIESNRFGRPVTLITSPDHGLAFSPRIVAGYEGPQGLGVRAQWWHFSDEDSGPGRISLSNPTQTFDVDASTELKVDSLILEMTQKGRFHNWEFLVSGGVRYAQLDSLSKATWGGTPATFFNADSDFDGLGPTLGFSARRSMRQWEGLTFLVNSRFSFLFGDVQIEHKSNLSGTELGPFTELDVEDVMPTWDLQIGAQWARRLNGGATFYLGAFFEAQLWDWIGPGLINSDLGFWGPTLAIGISR